MDNNHKGYQRDVKFNSNFFLFQRKKFSTQTCGDGGSVPFFEMVLFLWGTNEIVGRVRGR
jgi:hypothetical protein